MFILTWVSVQLLFFMFVTKNVIFSTFHCPAAVVLHCYPIVYSLLLDNLCRSKRKCSAIFFQSCPGYYYYNVPLCFLLSLTCICSKCQQSFRIHYKIEYCKIYQITAVHIYNLVQVFVDLKDLNNSRNL